MSSRAPRTPIDARTRVSSHTYTLSVSNETCARSRVIHSFGPVRLWFWSAFVNRPSRVFVCPFSIFLNTLFFPCAGSTALRIPWHFRRLASPQALDRGFTSTHTHERRVVFEYLRARTYVVDGSGPPRPEWGVWKMPPQNDSRGPPRRIRAIKPALIFCSTRILQRCATRRSRRADIFLFHHTFAFQRCDPCIF